MPIAPKQRYTVLGLHLITFCLQKTFQQKTEEVLWHIHLPGRLRFTPTRIWILPSSILISCLPFQIEKRDQIDIQKVLFAALDCTAILLFLKRIIIGKCQYFQHLPTFSNRGNAWESNPGIL